MAKVNLFRDLAAEHDVSHRVGTSPDGHPEEYLYSADMTYRYGFRRWWTDGGMESTAVWVLLNPATGDTEQRRRPTLERAIGWSRELGATGIAIVNLFGLRSTDPALLKQASDPVGPANDAVLAAVGQESGWTVGGWGAGGALYARGSTVTALLPGAICLGHTAKGEPRHPLYVRSGTPFVPLVDLAI